MWFTTIVLMAYAVLIIYTTMQKMPGTGMFVELMAAFFEGHVASYFFILRQYVWGYIAIAIAMSAVYMARRDYKLHKKKET